MGWYKPEIFGTVSDWIGIIASVLTIYFTIRFYNKDNKVDFKIILFDRLKKEDLGWGVISTSNKELVIQGVNFSKFPQQFIFLGFEKKNNWYDNIKIKLKKQDSFILPLNILEFLNDERDFELVNPQEKTNPIVINFDYMVEYLTINKFELKKGFFIVYSDISGKKFKREMRM